ncbi:hypothetical protein HYT02_06175 [Candidatus Gottesmanbacteria bacterium]|nr:hypothetical protein [Candidatus Gottesmanbacteria bacterium]
MKKILPLFLIIFIISPQLVLAKTEQASPAGNTVRDQVQDARANAQQARFNGIRQMFNAMINRLNAAVTRLETLGSRIQSRLTKLEASGVEVSALQDDLNQAQETLAGSKEDIASLTVQLEDILAGDNPKIAFVEIRTSIASIKTDLKTVLSTYTDIIRQMKGLGEKPKTNPATQSGVLE